ncbi:MAG: hypothetical protein M0Z48_04730 [Nitrospiraceae bacterium]|nr:hypothetical protein [Nitrospiraceae bacterium]
MIRGLIITVSTGGVLFLGVLGYTVSAAVRVRVLSPIQFSLFFAAILALFLLDFFMYRGARIIGEPRWGQMPERSQYALIGITVTFTWLTMKTGVLKLALIVIVLNLAFLYIGIEYLPQSESRPPKTIVLKPGISQADLVSIGEKIVFDKGQCMVCHSETPSTTERAPAMATIGAEIAREAKERGITPEQHLFESLVSPVAYIVKGFKT